MPSAAEASELLARLFPINRSLTGDGVRETLRIVQDLAPEFEIHEYASGTQVYDWTIPDEWKIRDGYIADSTGKRLVDFQKNALHVMGYSSPIDAMMSFDELRPHLHTLPQMPDAIPYRTSYFRRAWGFCLTHAELDAFDPGETYRVVIDAELFPGQLTLADSRLVGEAGKEFLFSTYCCHPWMANDNLSGIVMMTYVHRLLAARKHRHTYRFVMAPETIGAITYLAHNETAMTKIDGGMIMSCCAGQGKFAYKESYLGDSLIDRAVRVVFRDANRELWHRPFAPDGSDERQYSMPAFRIPMGILAKDKFYDYDFYHTSKDDLSFVTGETLTESLSFYMKVIDVLEENRLLKSKMPYCEPQLGKRGLYPQTGGGMKQGAAGAQSDVEAQVDAITWVMFLADGTMDLLAMSERSGQPFENLVDAAAKLEANDLLVEIA